MLVFVSHLSLSIRFIQTLHTLLLRSNEIGPTGAKYLSKALCYNKVDCSSFRYWLYNNLYCLTQTLTYLRLEHNMIECSGAKHLAYMLKINTVISILSLIRTYVTYNLSSLFFRDTHHT